jgi:hypothetical protein
MKHVKKHTNDENTPPVESSIVKTHQYKTKNDEANGEDSKINGTMLWELCLDDPCIWITLRREEMLDYDDNAHARLLLKDWPPHNMCCKKIYRWMALYTNLGPSGRGVWIECPKCSVDGCCNCFPSSTFM